MLSGVERMKKFLILIVILAIFFLGFFVWWNRGLSAVNPQNKQTQFFVIPQGQGIREISNNLKEQGLIQDPIVFFLLVKQKGIDEKIQAGDFRLSPSMTALQIAENLTHGSIDVWVTIPEGQRADEIADTLQQKIPSYEESWRASLRKEEGYLFPDTYLIPKDATVETVTTLLTNTFYTRVKEMGLTQNSQGLNRLVTIASLIEREAITDAEKPIISGIINNRLDLGMALQVDATIQYAKGKRGNTYWAPVTQEEYRSVRSNYNTYLSPGLPPTPIANPGLSALRAAQNPADTPYLYYLHDKNGTIRYGRTLDEHNENIQKYGL